MKQALTPLLAAVLLTCLLSGIASADIVWVTLDSGLEYGTGMVVDDPEYSDGTIHVLRIDSKYWDFKLLTAKTVEESRTAKQWAETNSLSAVINAGMFMDDGLTNVGYMKTSTGYNSKRIPKDFQSVLAFSPVASGNVPEIRMYDRKKELLKELVKKYNVVIQNLRLIKRPGKNVWSPKVRRWSESAIAQDGKNRILFIFMRTPLTMPDFNRLLLSLPLDIRCAQHVEGGPEASFVVNHPKLQLSLFGSYETDFIEADTNDRLFPLPNVLGIVKKN